MTPYTPRRPQAAPSTAPAWFAVALLAAAALFTLAAPAIGGVH